MADPKWREGFGHLARLGLRFDLPNPVVAPAARRRAREPISRTRASSSTTLAGCLPPLLRRDRRLAQGDRCSRRDAPMRRSKISGLGVRGDPGPSRPTGPSSSPAIDLFGVERAMFASNFPVDSLCASFRQDLARFAEIVEGLHAAEQRALFHDNAVRL
jgi:predicted TIM-barrel fold metal-dependent hydrolase